MTWSGELTNPSPKSLKVKFNKYLGLIFPWSNENRYESERGRLRALCMQRQVWMSERIFLFLTVPLFLSIDIRPPLPWKSLNFVPLPHWWIDQNDKNTLLLLPFHLCHSFSSFFNYKNTSSSFLQLVVDCLLLCWRPPGPIIIQWVINSPLTSDVRIRGWCRGWVQIVPEAVARLTVVTTLRTEAQTPGPRSGEPIVGWGPWQGSNFHKL